MATFGILSLPAQLIHSVAHPPEVFLHLPPGPRRHRAPRAAAGAGPQLERRAVEAEGTGGGAFGGARIGQDRR